MGIMAREDWLDGNDDGNQTPPVSVVSVHLYTAARPLYEGSSI